MARRRVFYPIDTSDQLANVVLSFIATLIVALLALILWMTSSSGPATAAPGSTGDVGAAQARVPASDPAATEGATPGAEAEAEAEVGSGADAGGDGAVAGDVPDDAPAAGGADADDGAPSTGAAGAVPPAGAPPSTGPAPEATRDPADADPSAPSGESGLFGPDDPDRMPAITVRAAPRDVKTVVADFDGDGEDERVWSAIVRDQVLTRLDRRVDGRWRPGRALKGAAADRLVELRAVDLTDDGLPEVFTTQWVATEGESVTLWSADEGALQRMAVRGGCWRDTNTIGLIGASIRIPADGPARIVALCEDQTLPTQQWPAALYRWRQGAWTFDRLLGT